jgi:hypothetical protein
MLRLPDLVIVVAKGPKHRVVVLCGTRNVGQLAARSPDNFSNSGCHCGFSWLYLLFLVACPLIVSVQRQKQQPDIFINQSPAGSITNKAGGRQHTTQASLGLAKQFRFDLDVSG